MMTNDDSDFFPGQSRGQVVWLARSKVQLGCKVQGKQGHPLSCTLQLGYRRGLVYGEQGVQEGCREGQVNWRLGAMGSDASVGGWAAGCRQGSSLQTTGDKSISLQVYWWGWTSRVQGGVRSIGGDRQLGCSERSGAWALGCNRGLVHRGGLKQLECRDGSGTHVRLGWTAGVQEGHVWCVQLVRRRLAGRLYCGLTATSRAYSAHKEHTSIALDSTVHCSHRALQSLCSAVALQLTHVVCGCRQQWQQWLGGNGAAGESLHCAGY